MKKKGIKIEGNLSPTNVSELKKQYLLKKGKKANDFDIDQYEDLKKQYMVSKANKIE